MLNSKNLTIINKDIQYTASSGGDTCYVITNGITGNITTAHKSGTDAIPPTIIYKDGTKKTTSFGTFELTKDMLALAHYDAINHVASYTFKIT